MANFVDLTGQKFGRLTVEKFVGFKTFPSGQRQTLWKCLCDCGTMAITQSTCLKSGHSKSCGCLKSESSRIRAIERNTKHNLTSTRLFPIWLSMKQRCENKNHFAFDLYGGRGIKVCEEWHDFQTFYDWAMTNGYDEDAKYGECTLDRIDVNGNYEPSNCRWVSQKIQSNNTRRNRILLFNGKSQTLNQWAEEFGISHQTISNRLKKGYPIEIALTLSVRSKS